MDKQTRTSLEQMRDWRWRGNPHNALHPLASALLQFDQQMTEHRHGTSFMPTGPMIPVQTETPRSSPVIEPQEETQPGSSTSSVTLRPAKEEGLGDVEITVTVTCPVSSSLPKAGAVFKYLREEAYHLLTRSTLEWQQQSGPTPSIHLDRTAAGPLAGGVEMSPDTASGIGPEGRFAEEEQG